MTIKFNVSGSRRTALAKAVAEFTGEKSNYQGPPSFAYTVGNYTISRSGELEKADGIAPEILDYLADRGFEAEPAEPTKLEIGVSEKTADIETLKAIIASKENLLKHAFATDDVSLTLEDGKILLQTQKRKTQRGS